MKLHKEGTTFIISSIVFFIAFTLLTLYVCPWCSGPAALSLLAVVFNIRFFRFPQRPLKKVDGAVLSPCDGKIVIVEEVEETEYFKDRRIQVSVFMSVNNVHINWAPISGRVEYFRHHQGKYLVAWHPKSSEKNERTTFVVDNGTTKVLFRQIAGYIARRIVTYAKEGDAVEQNQQIGFIKFGSRMDLFLPLGTDVRVKVGDVVKGTETILAKIN